jgi:hypothetical protein
MKKFLYLLSGFVVAFSAWAQPEGNRHFEAPRTAPEAPTSLRAALKSSLETGVPNKESAPKIMEETRRLTAQERAHLRMQLQHREARWANP